MFSGLRFCLLYPPQQSIWPSGQGRCYRCTMGRGEKVYRNAFREFGIHEVFFEQLLLCLKRFAVERSARVCIPVPFSRRTMVYQVPPGECNLHTLTLVPYCFWNSKAWGTNHFTVLPPQLRGEASSWAHMVQSNTGIIRYGAAGRHYGSGSLNRVFPLSSLVSFGILSAHHLVFSCHSRSPTKAFWHEFKDLKQKWWLQTKLVLHRAGMPLALDDVIQHHAAEVPNAVWVVLPFEMKALDRETFLRKWLPDETWHYWAIEFSSKTRKPLLNNIGFKVNPNPT